MGDWKPDGRRFTVDGTEHVVYSWTIPKRAARLAARAQNN
jgi:hypothetical protein